jgi:hypothetical protein
VIRFAPRAALLALAVAFAAADDYDVDVLKRRVAELEAEVAQLKAQGVTFQKLNELHASVSFPVVSDRQQIDTMIAFLGLGQGELHAVEAARSELRKGLRDLIEPQHPNASDDGKTIELKVVVGPEVDQLESRFTAALDQAIGAERAKLLMPILRGRSGRLVPDKGSHLVRFTRLGGGRWDELHEVKRGDGGQSTSRGTYQPQFDNEFVWLRPWLPADVFGGEKPADAGAAKPAEADGEKPAD